MTAIRACTLAALLLALAGCTVYDTYPDYGYSRPVVVGPPVVVYEGHGGYYGRPHHRRDWDRGWHHGRGHGYGHWRGHTSDRVR